VFRKTALTAYGKVGSDWTRTTLARVIEDNTFVFVRADGSNSILPVLPETFRTSGDIANVTATLGRKVSMAAVPSVALPNHTWKTTFTLDEIAAKFGIDESIVAAVRSTYADDEAIAA
jgi:hypothetical protein